MKNLFVAGVMTGLFLQAGFSHLCNDVFAQARDNLAVKVDVRDGQLRITDSGTFRVYLLNTMDRSIANINLEVVSEAFDAEVKPSKDWQEFPVLMTSVYSGTKQYFEVTLKRKSGVPEGKYQIGLTLFNGLDKSMIFKTVDIKNAIDSYEIPKISQEISIDGNANSSEWKSSLLCANLYEYQKADYSQVYTANDAAVQTRCRFLHDADHLYCLVDFQKRSGRDSVDLYLSQTGESEPLIVNIDSDKQTVNCSAGSAGVQKKFSGTKAEIMIPLKALKLSGQKSFQMNIVRSAAGAKSYWKGNQFSYKVPEFYGTMILN